MSLKHTPTPNVTAIDTPYLADQVTSIQSAGFDDGPLRIQVASAEWTVQVSFDTWYGFRVLDELDLAEFWSHCSLKTGWLYEVLNGGWKDLELSRPHFFSGRQSWVKEYLVIGLNECVSVLSKESPAVLAIEPSKPSFKRTLDGAA